MVKKVLIIAGISTIVLIAAIVVALMVYSPKQSQANVPMLEIVPAKAAANKKSKSRFEILNEAKFNKPKVEEKQIAPVFELDEILTKESKADSIKNPVDDTAVASLDTVSIIEAMLKEKRKQSDLKSAKSKSRVGDKKKSYAAKPAKKSSKPVVKKRVIPAPPKVTKNEVAEEVVTSDYMADKNEKQVSYKEKKTYSFNYISNEAAQAKQGDFVRAELIHKVKVRSGRNGVDLKLLEACMIGERSYIQGDILHGFSLLSGDRVQINIHSITSGETGETEFVSLDVYDNDFQKGLAYDATANNEKKRLIRSTSRDLIPNRVPGANTARSLVNTIAGTANGKFAKGYQVRVSIANKKNNYTSYHNNQNN